MKRKMNINNIFNKLLFAFICIFAVGVMNVNALTVEVSNESQLKSAVDGQKEVDDVKVNDTDTTIVKLVDDIELTSYLEIVTITDLTLDLNGHTISGETNSQSVGVTYGSNGLSSGFTSGSLTIKDSSSGKLGAIKSYDAIFIANYNIDTTSTKNFKLTIEGGKFYTFTTGGIIFNLDSNNNYYMKDKNITFDFQIKDGHFETSRSQAVLFSASSIDANNVTLNVNYDKLTFKGTQGRLITSDKTFTVNDVVSADSNIKLKYSILNTEATLTDRTLSAITYNAFNGVLSDYDTIEITKTEGFDVEDVTLNETYGYTAESATAKGIAIKNRGTSNLQIKNVTVSGGTSSNFIITGTAQPTLAAGATDNTSYNVKPKPGLNAGTYTETITVTDMGNKTYTATITLIVAKKVSTGVSIDMQSFMYGETPSVLDVDYGDLQTGQYKIEYSVKNDNDWKTTAPN